MKPRKIHNKATINSLGCWTHEQFRSCVHLFSAKHHSARDILETCIAWTISHLRFSHRTFVALGEYGVHLVTWGIQCASCHLKRFLQVILNLWNTDSSGVRETYLFKWKRDSKGPWYLWKINNFHFAKNNRNWDYIFCVCATKTWEYHWLVSASQIV